MDTGNKDSNRDIHDLVDDQSIDTTQDNQSNVDEEKADKTAEKEQKVIGRPFPKGVSGNPAGRPKGSISIKTRIKQKFEENPELFEKYLDSLIEKESALTWQMLEGRPIQKLAGDEENPLRIITVDKDLANIYGITPPNPEDDSEGSKQI